MIFNKMKYAKHAMNKTVNYRTMLNNHRMCAEQIYFFSCIFSFSRRTNATKPVAYNATLLGCTWDSLIKKGRRASHTFPYPTFGIRGMTSIEPLYWILVVFFEWLPSLLCDIVFSIFGRKQRYGREIYREISRVTNLSS